MHQPPERPRPAKLTTGASRHGSQEGPPLVFSAATHHFAEKDDWDLVVVKKGESTHAEVCSFARSAALRNLFVQRLRVGAQPGDDIYLTRLLWPCATDVRYMLSGPVPLLPPGLLGQLAKEVGVVQSIVSVSETELWRSLRGALGCGETGRATVGRPRG